MKNLLFTALAVLLAANVTAQIITSGATSSIITTSWERLHQDETMYIYAALISHEGDVYLDVKMSGKDTTFWIDAGKQLTLKVNGVHTVALKALDHARPCIGCASIGLLDSHNTGTRILYQLTAGDMRQLQKGWWARVTLETNNEDIVFKVGKKNYINILECVSLISRI